MDLKNYSERPDEGLFERIESRVRRRRMVRRTGVALAVLMAVAGGLLVLWPHTPSDKGGGVAQLAAPSEKVSHPMTVQTDTSQALLPVQATCKDVGIANASPAQPVANVSPRSQDEPAEKMPLPSVISADNSVRMQAAPMLDSVSIKQSVVEVEDLILHSSTESSDEVASQFKIGDSTVAVPHYDNVLWAPNAIAPGSDDDAMRRFRITSTCVVSDFRLFIFNRAGRQVFSSTDINSEWDATCNGVNVPQGAYVWVARFRDSHGRPQQEKGTVTVIR